MPTYVVKLLGNAWCVLDAVVEAESENEAHAIALQQGQWRITGDVEEVKISIADMARDDSK